MGAVIQTAGNTLRIAPYTELFWGGASTPGPGATEVVEWRWDFGELSQDPRYDSGPAGAHTYPAGSYTVTLTTTDDKGQSSQASVALTVAAFAGTTYYVASNGSNSNNGTSSATPWQTLSYAFTNMGGTLGNPNRLLIRRGDSFSQTGNLNPPTPSILGAYGSGPLPNIVFTQTTGLYINDGGGVGVFGRGVALSDLKISRPARDDDNIVQFGAEGSSARRCVFLNGTVSLQNGANYQKHKILEDCVVSGSDFIGYSIYHADWVALRRCISVGAGISRWAHHQVYYSGGNYALFQDCFFDGAKTGQNYAGIKLSGTDYVFVSRCRMTGGNAGIDNGANPGEGYATNEQIYIDRCRIWDLGWDNSQGGGVGIVCNRAHDTLITNCVVHNIHRDASQNLPSMGINFGTPTSPGEGDPLDNRVRVFNCVVYDVQDVPLMSCQDSWGRGLELKNNVWVRLDASTGQNKLFYRWRTGFNPTTELTADRNCFWWPGQTSASLTIAVGSDNPTHSFDGWRSTFGKDTFSFYADPLFHNPPCNFTLKTGSPCIDAGETLPPVRFDLYGVRRPQGVTSLYDVGAVEDT